MSAEVIKPPSEAMVPDAETVAVSLRHMLKVVKGGRTEEVKAMVESFVHGAVSSRPLFGVSEEEAMLDPVAIMVDIIGALAKRL